MHLCVCVLCAMHVRERDRVRVRERESESESERERYRERERDTERERERGREIERERLVPGVGYVGLWHSVRIACESVFHVNQTQQGDLIILANAILTQQRQAPTRGRV